MLKFWKRRFMIRQRDVVFGDKKMKTCVECGKKLGIIGGYRHPSMGKEYPVCGTCFDTVIESVENYRQFIAPYVDFFHKESSTREDLQTLGNTMKKSLKITQTKRNALSFHPTHHNTKC